MFNYILGQTQYTQDFYEKKPSFGVYAAEFGGAALGTTGCVSIAGGTFFVYYLAAAKEFNRGNYLGSWGKFLEGFAVASTILIGMPAATAYGVQKVGEKLDQNGSYWASFGGSLGGAIIGAGLGYSISRINPEKINIAYAIIPTTLLGHWVGAVVGYNLSRNSGDDFGCPDTRFELPTIGIRTEDNVEGKTINALDFRLINVRS